MRRAGEHTERSPKRKQDGGRRVGRAGGREGETRTTRREASGQRAR